jgi:predicted nicotinamide N-methyase
MAFIAAMKSVGVFEDDVELALELDATLLEAFAADTEPDRAARFRERVLAAAYSAPPAAAAAAAAAAGFAPEDEDEEPSDAGERSRERALERMEAVVMQSILDESAATGGIDGMSAADLQAAMSVVLSGGEVGEVEASASAAASELLLSALGAASPPSPPFLFNTSIPVVAGAEARRAVTIALETSEEDELEGSIVWDSAIVLARLLLDEAKFHPKFFAPPRRFLELGAGCGLAGIAAALRGAAVTLTDIAGVLPRLRRNVEVNRHLLAEAEGGAATLDVAELDWTRLAGALADPAATVRAPYDVILLADCVYQADIVEPLVDALIALSGPKTVILCALRCRFRFQADFLAQANLFFSGSPLRPDAAHLDGVGRPDSLLFLRLKKRPDDE